MRNQEVRAQVLEIFPDAYCVMAMSDKGLEVITRDTDEMSGEQLARIACTTLLLTAESDRVYAVQRLIVNILNDVASWQNEHAAPLLAVLVKALAKKKGREGAE